MGTNEIITLLLEHGDSQYGHEAVTQLQHALQTAMLAEQAGATPELIVAALLHDVGHMLHDLPDDAPDQGIDDHHENSGYQFAREHFPPEVSEPIRLHVAAKRYLVVVDLNYRSQLSEPSLVSLELQGGPMRAEEIVAFEANPHAKAAVELRRWDDRAKDPECVTPSLKNYEDVIESVLRKG